MPDKNLEKLIKHAKQARNHAVAPYSHFKVGAALEDLDGNVWTGCNVESSSYGLSICAERNAIFKALSEGKKHFTRMIIAASGNDLVFPCGACRQIIYDFAPDLEVHIYDPVSQKIKSSTINQLYPFPFGTENLKEDK